MSVFEDWTEKYEFIISLGRKLPAMPEKYRKNSNLIKGCQSRVWVGTEMDDGKLIIKKFGSKPGTFLLYDDDGETFAYERGEYTLRELHA